MQREELYIVKTDKGYLKGNGKAYSLKYAKTPKAGRFFTTLKQAKSAIANIRSRGIRECTIVVVELVVHGTVDDILERDLLGGKDEN